MRTDLTRAWAADFTLESVVTSLPSAEEAPLDVAHWLAASTTHATLRADDGGGLRLVLPDRPLPTGGLARYELPPRPGGAAAALPPGDVASRVGTVLTHAARMVKARDDLLAERGAQLDVLARALERRTRERAGRDAPPAAARVRSGGGGSVAVAAALAAAHASQLLLSPPSVCQGAGGNGGASQAVVARLASQAGSPPAATQTGGLAPPPRPARPGVQVVKRKRGVGAPTAARGGATRARGAG